MIKNLKCDYCAKEIVSNNYYESNNLMYCEECGNLKLVNTNDDLYVLQNFYKDVYLDDEISDLEIFEKRRK